MDKKKKNLLIGGLLAIVLLLAVGYAAFATTLTINGTSSIDSRWDVHIKDNGVNPDLTTKVAADSVTAQKDSQLTGSFSCNLTTPGISTIDYIIEVENSGTFGAKLSSISITGETYYIGTSLSKSSLKQGDVVAGNGGSDTITVTVSYKDVDIVPTLQADKQVAITVTLNFVQDDGASSGGGSSNVINGLIIDQTFKPDYYEFQTTRSEVKIGSSYDTSTWTQDPTTLGRDYYLGHDVTITSGTTGEVTANYACFVLNNTQYCMKSGTSGTNYYEENLALLSSLKESGTITCSDFPPSKNYAVCSSSSLGYLNTGPYGGVTAGVSNSLVCSALNDGSAYCGAR